MKEIIITCDMCKNEIKSNAYNIPLKIGTFNKDEPYFYGTATPPIPHMSRDYCVKCAEKVIGVLTQMEIYNEGL